MLFRSDIKQDNDHFLTPPASVEDIKNNPLCRREFFLKLNSSNNNIIRTSRIKKATLEAGLLYHTMKYQYPSLNLEITNFIPYDLNVELMWVRVTAKQTIKIIPTSFIPLYGRSENNLRNHRHVSSLLNRIQLNKYGVILKPTMTFDERGHQINKTLYYVLGYQNNLTPPQGQFPTILTFCGENGNLEYPQAVYGNLHPFSKKKIYFDGKEVCGALRFSPQQLKKEETADYIILSGISSTMQNIKMTLSKLSSCLKVKKYLEQTKQYWCGINKGIKFSYPNKTYNNWLKWVSLQPNLRKLFGCSFLPHFDYGKGGQGWRDLWQDILSLLWRDRKSTRLNSSHTDISRMPSSA